MSISAPGAGGSAVDTSDGGAAGGLSTSQQSGAAGPASSSHPGRPSGISGQGESVAPIGQCDPSAKAATAAAGSTRGARATMAIVTCAAVLIIPGL